MFRKKCVHCGERLPWYMQVWFQTIMTVAITRLWVEVWP